ncbi:MAG: hypothetical protein M0020_01855 [Actinomycetota bacterium]|nr:hypothetical protein [Actinomycetota bacterium]
MSSPVSYEDATLHLIPWHDPLVDRLGHDPRSPYVETFWLPVLGPSATWLLRRVAAGLEAAPNGYTVCLSQAARSLGLGSGAGRNAPLRRTLARCQTFGMARSAGPAGLAVRTMLPPLPRRHLIRLPEPLQAWHRRWDGLREAADRSRAGGGPTTFEQARVQSRDDAMSLLEAGCNCDEAEALLLRGGCHPALTHDAVVWARTERARPSQSAGSDGTAASGAGR